MVLRVSGSKMLIFHQFSNGFGGVGIDNVDFPLVFQWFWGCRDRQCCFSIGFSMVLGGSGSKMLIFHSFFNGF